ncbi:MAG: hypothetical protein ABJB11_00310 [Ferruginibacter sp.]
MNQELLTRRQIANHFGVTYATVYQWERKGIIKHHSTFNERPRYNLQDVINSVTNKKGGEAKCK